MKRIFNNTGSSIIVTVISFVVILGFASLVTDIGLTMYEKQKLWNAVDAAALAGVQNINKDIGTVRKVAKEYASLNGVELQDINIKVSEDKKSVEVYTDKNVQYFFAKVLGINQNTVAIKSIAKAAPLVSTRGIRPLAIVDQEFDYNTLYVLKEGAGDGYSGNYGPLALGGNGASIFENNLLYGYSGEIKVGDMFYTQTGNISQVTRRSIEHLIDLDAYSTYNNFEEDSSRLIIIPVVNTLDVSGKKPIYVVGFAAFFLEGTQQSGGHTEIVGRFVRHVTEGDYSDTQTDYGLKGIKLIK